MTEVWTHEAVAQRAAADKAAWAAEQARRAARDPRDPDPTKIGIFRDHRCWKCNDGEKPCAEGRSSCCSYPRARND